MQTSGSDENRLHYEGKYCRPDYFSYERKVWLYRPWTRTLLGAAGLQAGDRVLDAGCGQGFFSWLISGFGFAVTGVDLSAEGISMARSKYGFSGVRFEVGNVLSLPYVGEFDCVFVRGCSLYNSEAFPNSRDCTDALLKCLKPGGVLVFSYHTNLCPRRKSSTWAYHSLAAVRSHFAPYPKAQVYFSMRLEASVLGRFAFSGPVTLLAGLLSRVSGFGGEAVALIRKPGGD